MLRRYVNSLADLKMGHHNTLLCVIPERRNMEISFPVYFFRGCDECNGDRDMKLEPIYTPHSPSAVPYEQCLIFGTVFNTYYDLRCAVTYVLRLENLRHESNNATICFCHIHWLDHKPQTCHVYKWSLIFMNITKALRMGTRLQFVSGVIQLQFLFDQINGKSRTSGQVVHIFYFRLEVPCKISKAFFR